MKEILRYYKDFNDGEIIQVYRTERGELTETIIRSPKYPKDVGEDYGINHVEELKDDNDYAGCDYRIISEDEVLAEMI